MTPIPATEVHVDIPQPPPLYSPEHRQQFIASMLAELAHAYAKHGARPWSRHEFYAVMKEEVDELWDAVKQDRPIEEVLKEAMQIACVCLRYAETPDAYRGPHPLPLPCRIDMEKALELLPPAHPAASEPDWKAVAADYAEQLRQIRRRDDAANAAGEGPHAWLVNCPPGHEFDSLVFPDKEGADIRADDFNADCPEGESPYVAIPLYAKPSNPAASDWRSGCSVERAKDGRWEVLNPAKTHWLLAGDNEWEPLGGLKPGDCGNFDTETEARAALSIAPPPPGVGR